MHFAIKIFEFWALAFLSLCLAVLLLNIFWSFVDDGLFLNSLGHELATAAIASLIEGASVLTVLTFVPAAARALIIPALMVGLLYKITHLEDWGRYEIFCLLLFQLVISIIGACFFIGQFGMAMIILVIFVGVLSALIGLMKFL
jgi:hypothetical protein